MKTGLSLLILALFLILPASAQTPKEVTGTVEKIDATKGTITLRWVESAGFKSKTFSLLKEDLPILHPSGRNEKLSALGPKSRVIAKLNESDDVVSIRDESDSRWGTLMKLESSPRALVIKFPGIAQTVLVPGEAPLTVDGKQAAWSVLKEGQTVKLVYSPDHRTVRQVIAGKGTALTFNRAVYRGGIVIGVDHTRNRIRILTLPERLVVRELEYDPWAGLRLVYSSTFLREQKIQDLIPYCRVSYYEDTESGRVVAVSADAPVLSRRKVLEWDELSGKMVVLFDDEKLELKINRDAKVMTAQGPGRLDQLAIDTLINAGLSLDGKEVLYLHLWEPKQK